MRTYWLPALIFVWLALAIPAVLRSADPPKATPAPNLRLEADLSIVPELPPKPGAPPAPATPAPAAPAGKATPAPNITPRLTMPLVPPTPPAVPLTPPNPADPTGFGPQTSVPPVAPAEPLDIFPDAMAGLGPSVSTPAPRSTVALPPRNWIDQTQATAARKSAGCMDCHKTTDAHTMHESPNVVLGCTDCHGGNPARGLAIQDAHVRPQHPEFWETSANPPNSTTLLNHESAEFIRFVNPGDLRVADQACGLCHGDIVTRVRHSMMNHGAMLWNAAAYNNGAIQLKNPIVGQAYGADGMSLKLNNPFKPTAEETRTMGILETIIPLPRFNRSQTGNVFRIFEKGGAVPLFLGSPTLDEPPGKPERRLSERGLGTLNRTDPTILGAIKTRLHDPLLSFMGSNDRPGDYRSSGCSACHVVYANDRSPTNSGWWSKFGHQGLSFSKDPTIAKNERGHPVFHKFTRAIPSSQCMNCHMHQGNLFVNPYLGYTWWDQETEGEHMYPKEQHDPTEQELARVVVQNPEAASARGLWKDRDFLEKVAELNPKLKHTQLADYHGHGWIFRAVFKKDRKGNLLDLQDKVVPHGDFKHAVHLNDVHLEKKFRNGKWVEGMQCADCHFDVDVHGNGLLYGEPRNATTTTCVDCHGTVTARPTLITTGVSGHYDPKNPKKIVPVDLSKSVTPWKPRFEWIGLDGPGTPQLIQNSTMSPNVRWEVPQTIDVITPGSSRYNAKARYAKTLRRDGEEWGDIKMSPEECAQRLAHSNEKMDCQVCHSSWATSCFGCHLPMKANQRTPTNKSEGPINRNFVTYNPQVVRDEVYMLGIDGTVKKHRMAPIRSSSAVLVGSQNANREWIYSQQQTVSAEGYSGQAFNPHFPHTTSSKGTTKNCTDCHLSKANDNNAWMTSLLGFGTGTVNFFGRYAWVGGDGELNGIIWTEPEEPQAPIGSNFHRIAYPKNWQIHVDRDRQLRPIDDRGYERQAYHHHAKEINDITLRSEYVYTANGTAGFEVFDIANIDQKGFSERFLSAPVSPLGQKTYVRSKFATSAALPSTLLNDPLRVRLPVNEETPIHPIYGYVFVTDRYEGLIIVDTACLFDGDPENNFLRRAKLKDSAGNKIGDAYNPDGILTGAEYAVCAGHRVYICTPRGLAVVDVNSPEQPRLVGELAPGYLRNPRAISIQFRYAFVTDDDGLKVIDISDPIRPRAIPGAMVRLRDAKKLYVARTYAYVANGAEGLAIIDVENPERPRLDQMFNANGELNDTRAVQIGSVAASMYALIADGKNGFRVLQMISPDTVDGAAGFSPRPAPRLIATYHTHHAALAVSRGLDRDRVVDETGSQTVVFGRRGSRPFRLDEMRPFLQHRDGETYRVADVVVKRIVEEKEVDGKKQRTERDGVFTNDGRELVDPNPPPPKPKLETSPLRPGPSPFDLPFSGVPPPAPPPPAPPPPAEPVPTPPAPPQAN